MKRVQRGEIRFKVSDVVVQVTRSLDGAKRNPGHPGFRFASSGLQRLRSSNTEPLLRLNVETRGDAELLERRTRELQALIGC